MGALRVILIHMFLLSTYEIWIVLVPLAKKLFLRSAYMKYIRESIGFTPKILKIFFCSKHVFYR
jgi:hypothetical protein